VTELRFATDDSQTRADQLADLADRMEVLPTGCCSTPTTARR
jgi:hypothetical protein